MYVYWCDVEFSCTGWGTTVGRSPAPGGKRVQKISYVLIVNRNRTEGLWKVRRQKRRENKDTWKHQNFRVNVELISVYSIENEIPYCRQYLDSAVKSYRYYK